LNGGKWTIASLIEPDTTFKPVRQAELTMMIPGGRYVLIATAEIPRRVVHEPVRIAQYVSGVTFEAVKGKAVQRVWQRGSRP
jgi:hypothetical protein